MKKYPTFVNRKIYVNRQNINDMLPDIPESFRAEMQYLIEGMPYREKEKPMRRKLSVGLVFAIVLMIAAVTALAALSLRAYYERTIEQTAQSGLVEDWDVDEKVRLVDWMVEAGLDLDTEQVARLHDGSLLPEQQAALAMEIISGYYPARQGALTVVDIIAKEKGPYESWSIEDKAWFTQMLYQYGEPAHSSLYTYNVMPDGTQGDITKEEAIKIARGVLKQQYGLNDSDLDTMNLNEYFVLSEDMSYLLPGETERQTGTLRLWMIRYIPQGTDSEYWVNMRNDGVVLEFGKPVEPAVAYEVKVPGSTDRGISAEEARSIPTNEVLDKYRDIYGSHNDWTMETWISFQEDLSLSAEVFGRPSTGLSCILQQKYLIPDEQVIPRQKAIDTVFAIVQGEGDATQQETRAESAVLLMDGDTPVWKIWIGMWNSEGGYTGYYSEVNALTGKVRNSYAIKDLSDSWYEPYVLERTLPDPTIERGNG